MNNINGLANERNITDDTTYELKFLEKYQYYKQGQIGVTEPDF